MAGCRHCAADLVDLRAVAVELRGTAPAERDEAFWIAQRNQILARLPNRPPAVQLPSSRHRLAPIPALAAIAAALLYWISGVTPPAVEPRVATVAEMDGDVLVALLDVAGSAAVSDALLAVDSSTEVDPWGPAPSDLPTLDTLEDDEVDAVAEMIGEAWS